MQPAKRSWDLLTEDERKNAINEIINFYQSDRDESIGVIAAEEILDAVLQATSSHIYNKGIEDTKTLFKERVDGMIIDIEASLKK